MYNDKIERDIDDGWYSFIDVVGGSDQNLSILCQLEKIGKLKYIIACFLHTNNNPEIYKSFTGDGMLIAFLDYKFPIELSINIHKNQNEYSSSLNGKENIFVRTGKGFGSFLPFQDGVNKEFAPCDHELVISKRIMDLAKPNPILITDFAFQKI